MIKQETLLGRRFLFFLCGFELGGAERQALYFARYLKDLGCDVRVWGHHHRYAGPERVISQCEAAGIPWGEYKFRWPCGKVALIRDASRLLRGLYRERPDVILSYTTWPNMVCGLVWRLSPAKVFVWGQRDLAALNGTWLERVSYRAASAVICNAAHEREHMNSSLGKSIAPMYVVHNGIEVGIPEKTRSQWRSELGIREEAVIVTMLANLRTDKDHSTLLHAWRKVIDAWATSEPRLHLVLAGAQQESYRAVRSLIEELALDDSVSLPGQIGDVAGFLSACDIGVLCTRAEGLSNTMLEYMTCGLPIIATDIPGNREALGDGAGEQLCRPGEAESLADGLLALIHAPDARRRLSERNRQRALEKFSITKMCETMADIISGLLNGLPGRT